MGGRARGAARLAGALPVFELSLGRPPVSKRVGGSIPHIEHTAMNTTINGAPAPAVFHFQELPVAVILKDGDPWFVASEVCRALELQNSLDPFFALGSDSAVDINAGRCQVSGTVSAAFQNTTLLNKFIAETGSSLSIGLSDPLGNDLTILLPRIKYSGGDIPAQNEGRIVMNMPFTALLDSVTGTNIQITRTPA